MSKKSVREHFEILSSDALRQTSNDETDLRVTQEAANKVKKVGQALTEGKMPTTEQATVAMNKARLNNIERMDLSETGQQVLKKMDEAFANTTKLVAEKNKGDHIQHMIHHSKTTADTIKDGDLYSSSKKRSTKQIEETRKLLKDGGSNISLVAKLIVTSSEFRKLLGDFYRIFEQTVNQFTEDPNSRKLSNDGSIASNDSNKLSTRELRDQVIVGPVSKQNKTDEINENSSIPEELKKQSDLYNSLSSSNILVSNESKNNKEMDTKEVLNNTKEKLQESAKPAGKLISETIQSNFKDSKDGDFSKIHLEALETGKDLTKNVKARLQNIHISKEMEDKLINRFKNLCIEIQSNEEYKNAMVSLIENISKLSDHTQTYTKDLTNIASNQTETKQEASEITNHSRQIVENFAGGNSMDPMIDSLKNLAKKAEKDPQFRQYSKDLKNFIVDSLLNPNFVENNDEYNNKADTLIKESKMYLIEQYKEDTKQLIREVKQFNSSLQEDPTTNEFIKSFESLGRTLFLDENGKPTVKRELIDDVRKIIPIIGDKLKMLRLPRIEHEDEKVHVILDNVVLECAGILPHSVYIRTDTEFDVTDDQMLNAITLKIRNINGKAKKVAFYFKMKKGIISNAEEAGYIDVDIPKEGITLDITVAPQNVKLKKPKLSTNTSSNNSTKSLKTNSKDEYQRNLEKHENDEYIQVIRSNSRVHDIKIKLYDTKHPEFIYKLFSGIINRVARKKIEEGINDGMKQMFNQINTAVRNNLNTNKNEKQTENSTVNNSTTISSKTWKSDAFDI